MTFESHPQLAKDCHSWIAKCLMKLRDTQKSICLTNNTFKSLIPENIWNTWKTHKKYCYFLLSINCAAFWICSLIYSIWHISNYLQIVMYVCICRLYAYFTNKQALLLFTRVHFLSKCTEFPPLITQTDPLRMRWVVVWLTPAGRTEQHRPNNRSATVALVCSVR